MDANRQRFWQLATAEDWPDTSGTSPVEYDAECRRLRLRDRRPARSAEGTIDTAVLEGWRNTPSMARDAFGTVAYGDTATPSILADGARGGSGSPVTLFTVDAGESVTDLALGFDDVLYAAVRQADPGGAVTGARIVMIDRRGRWEPRSIEPPSGFIPQRLAADPNGGVWALDRGERGTGAAVAPGIARLTGLPLRTGQPGVFNPPVFRPVEENSTPPVLAIDPIQPPWAGDQAVDLACSPDGRLAVLTWLGTSVTRILLRTAEGRWATGVELTDAGRPANLAWLTPRRLVVIPAPRQEDGQLRRPREALAYDPDDGGTALSPAGGFLPLRGLTEGVFARGTTTPPHYPVGGNRLAPLLGLSVARYEIAGESTARMLDSLAERTTWHRLNLEGVFPARCGAVVRLAASDDPAFVPSDADWHEHAFGETSSDSLATGIARGAWLPDRSELPGHDGLLGRDPEPRRAGLFTVLIQRPTRRVRALRGRYLHVRVVLSGSGYATPEIAALRAYGSRFSYRDAYLPELYRETLFGADGDAAGDATGPDFLDRFLGLFESVLTPLEDRVANAHLWTDPSSAPEEALDWLGAWIGVLFDPGFPSSARRAWVAAAHQLFRTRGTFGGLQWALEIATGGRLVRAPLPVRRDGSAAPDPNDTRDSVYPWGGRVTGGEIVVIEDFRLRRTLATILGANLSVEDDPLLPGLIASGNSLVGDTLILGDERRKEFLALFRHAFSNNRRARRLELNSVADLYDRLANRVTVLVHDAVEPADFGLIRRIARREAPAHIDLRVERASQALLVGLASLVEVDTYLGPPRPRGVARLDSSRLGEHDFLLGLPSLDPRLERE